MGAPVHIFHKRGKTGESGISSPGVKMRRAVPVVLLHGKSMRRKGIDSSHQHMVCQPFHQGISFRPAIVSENLTKRPALFVRLDMGCGASQLCQSEMEKFAVTVTQKVVILEPSKEYTRDDGTKGISYNAKVVYDISETSAKERVQPQEQKSMRELVSALIDASPVPCVPVDDLELPAYYDSSQQTIFVKKGLSEEVLFISMAKEVSAAVYDFKYNESRDTSDFKSFCVAYMVSSRYGVDTKGFDFSRLPREYDGMDTQVFKGELGTMRDVLGEIQNDMYKSMEKNKPARNKEQER